MRKRVCMLVLMMTLFPALVGCGRVRYPTYYTLNLLAPPNPPASGKTQTSIAVREFQSPGYLQQGPIVYRSTPEQIGFYQYHRWAAEPRELVTAAVIDHLRASGQYAMVSEYKGRPDDDYILSGRLEKLEEVDKPAGVKVEVEVTISAQIVNVRTGATVWSNSVSEVGTVLERNVPGVVSEMNKTVESAISRLLSTVPMPTAIGR